MIKVNKNFENLKKNYLFVEMENRIKAYQEKNPQAKIIRLGIGDVTLPLCQTVIKAMHEAVDEMAKKETFKGYGPSNGYEFLREAISKSYLKYDIEIDKNDVYVSDGAKSDTANIMDIFDASGDVLIPDPAYPVYVDSSIIAGKNIHFVKATQENGFLPMPDYKISPSLIYICSPNNPTGAVYNKEQLKKWVDYALDKQAIIIFDAAYEPFIVDKDLPHSIYEIENAKKCAIEVCSFSKGAGFTGIRCAYTVVPSEIKVDGKKIGDIWMRRQSCKFNGATYITQKAALAALSENGQKENKEMVDYYRRNAKVLVDTMKKLGIWHVGGENSPYVWIKCPNNMKSWDFFDLLLKKANIVGTPGAGFGDSGEGYFRFSSFGNYEDVLEAASRLEKLDF